MYEFRTKKYVGYVVGSVCVPAFLLGTVSELLEASAEVLGVLISMMGVKIGR